MKALVVYESIWGNTAAIAHAIAEGMGSGVRALSTAQATEAALSDADLVVAGAPLLGFRMPNDNMLKMIADSAGKDKMKPDLSHPSMRSWLDALPKGKGRSASFETRIFWSPGGAAGTILRGLKRAGYDPVTKARRFIVKGKYGPLRQGELEKARLWGKELAKMMG